MEMKIMGENKSKKKLQGMSETLNLCRNKRNTSKGE